MLESEIFMEILFYSLTAKQQSPVNQRSVLVGRQVLSSAALEPVTVEIFSSSHSTLICSSWPRNKVK